MNAAAASSARHRAKASRTVRRDVVRPLGGIRCRHAARRPTGRASSSGAVGPSRPRPASSTRQYNFCGRFESGTGTNPEELLAAAHASCFTMALSVGLTQAGNPPESLATEAKVTVDQVEGGFGITKIALSVTGKVPGPGRRRLRGGRAGRQGGLPALEGARQRPRDHAGDELRGVACYEVRVDDAGAVVAGRARVRDRAQDARPSRGSRPRRRRPARARTPLEARVEVGRDRPSGGARPVRLARAAARSGRDARLEVPARRDLQDARGVEQRDRHRRGVDDRGDDLRVVDRAPRRPRPARVLVVPRSSEVKFIAKRAGARRRRRAARASRRRRSRGCARGSGISE